MTIAKITTAYDKMVLLVTFDDKTKAKLSVTAYGSSVSLSAGLTKQQAQKFFKFCAFQKGEKNSERFARLAKEAEKFATLADLVATV